MPNNKKSSAKKEIVFDPKKRREFLTGFQKRKNERRKKAKDQLMQHLKEERRRIRQEVKDGVKHLKKSFEPLRELTEEDKVYESDYEDASVKIVELSTNDLANQNNFIGSNTFNENTEVNESTDSEVDCNIDNDINCIPGMELNCKSTKNSEQNNKENGKSHKTEKVNFDSFKSKKDLDRLIKNKTLKKLHKSKAFKRKENFDKKANQKKVKRNKINTIKSLPKHLQKTKKFEQNRYRKGRLITKKDRKSRARNEK
ncbi:nucleolar protein 12 [Teleopsis dalmanni]|uniref:nucleolar protein 12 n=1 Tax=Teleopsis dalmanni TaxID=139649 RepID=UPI0018CE6615|nr:nucleolar protein 12 [Teleopsis dalmanni]